MSNKLKKNYIEMNEEEIEKVEVVEEEETEETKPSFFERAKAVGTKVRNSKVAKGIAIAGAVAGGVAVGLVLGGRGKGDSEDLDDYSGADVDGLLADLDVESTEF